MKRFAWFGVLCIMATTGAHCGSSNGNGTPPPDSTDAADTDASPDNGPDDTDTDTDDPPPPTVCESDNDCDDALFCNGQETCLPDHLDSSEDGCLAGIAPKGVDPNPIDCQTLSPCDENIDDFVLTNIDDGEACDDGIACTTGDVCDAFGNCTGATEDSQCDDGLFCNGIESCTALFGCVSGTSPTGTDDDPNDCLVPSTCIEATQSFDQGPAPAGTLCNDDVDCTFEDACTGAGTCGGVPNDGFCTNGQYCDGIEICDASNGCITGTTPDAPEDTDLTDCVAPTLCDEATDSFLDELVAVGTACDDGEACVENDQCDSAGTCSGTTITCDSSGDTTCSINTCDDTTGTCGPVFTASATTCNDGSSNTQSDECDGNGQCGGTTIACSDATTCTPTWTPNGVNCTPTHATQGTACDNGTPGTTGQCDGQGACTSNTTLCAENQFVSANACVACTAGTTNDAGDDASGTDTACDATLCPADEYVSANACDACFVGTTNAAGDDASGTDTTCDATGCPKTNAKIGWTTTLSTKFHDVTGNATIVDDCTIVIENFSFDGNGIDVKLYGGIDSNFEAGGFPIGPQLFNFPVGYDNVTLSFTLPANKTMDDLNSISVWCIAAGISFGDGVFIAP